MASRTSCFIFSSSSSSTRLHATRPPLIIHWSKTLRITAHRLTHFISSSLTLSLPTGSLTIKTSSTRMDHPHAASTFFSAAA